MGVKRGLARILGFPDSGPGFLRVTMYEQLVPLLQRELDAMSNPGRALFISGEKELGKPFRARGWEIVTTSFPDIDWHSLPFEDESFDAVASDQVLEHVNDPFQCAREALRVTRPGGLQVHTTCFINPIHHSPVDHWRFSPDGLRRLFAANEIDVGGWGNPIAPLLWLTPRLFFRPAPRADWHPLTWLSRWNHPRWPIVTWYVGRRAPASA